MPEAGPGGSASGRSDGNCYRGLQAKRSPEYTSNKVLDANRIISNWRVIPSAARITVGSWEEPTSFCNLSSPQATNSRRALALLNASRFRFSQASADGYVLDISRNDTSRSIDVSPL